MLKQPLVIDRQNCGLSNFPSTPESAAKDFQKFLEEKLKEGYVYAGPYFTGVNVDMRHYLIFYKQTSDPKQTPIKPTSV